MLRCCPSFLVLGLEPVTKHHKLCLALPTLSVTSTAYHLLHFSQDKTMNNVNGSIYNSDLKTYFDAALPMNTYPQKEAFISQFFLPANQRSMSMLKFSMTYGQLDL